MPMKISFKPGIYTVLTVNEGVALNGASLLTELKVTYRFVV